MSSYVRISPDIVSDGIPSCGIATTNADHHVVSNVGWWAPSQCSIVHFSCTGTTVKVKVARDNTAAVTAATPAADLAVYVDGVYSTNIRPTINTVAWFTLTVGAGSHSVDIVNAQYARIAGAGTGGSCVMAVSGTNVTVSKVAASRRMLMYGDSTLAACSTNQGQTDLIALTRSVYPGRVSCNALGGFFELDATEAHEVLRFKQMAADCTGSASIDMVSLIGVNDWANTAQLASAYRTRMASLMGACNTAFGSRMRRFWAVAPIPKASEAANGNGEVLGVFRTALSNAVADANTAAGSTIATFVDSTTWSINTGTDLFDGLHCNDAGAAKMHAGLRAAVGY